ncbi:hypothetical protein C8A05DRAFT_30307 [Staphylotrichum tortipilum]|uniref:Dihydroneopterin aldolase/epimerase domain-containing protein n=1 Tax=Staphylotrichum tortipilum TaxID=2831512 RepID=A0AAN6MSR0_9PEZI|nr:hypothetical protein C8A05DRAFT_30307 [Staphylotrichum longicolle]
MPHLQNLLPTPHLHALFPSPPAAVHVRNLHTTLQHAGHDAWNRAHKAQPCTLSASVLFSSPFAAAARDDRLGEETVHYGSLSKELLGAVGVMEGVWKNEGGERERGVGDVVGGLWTAMTGLGFDMEEAPEGWKGEGVLIRMGRVRLFSVTVGLPKASLLGEGVKLTAAAVFEGGRVKARARALEVSRLRVPTLVGVNKNERLAKQVVVVTVVVEGFTRGEDVYVEIEADVVKAMEESSFETLEALGAHLAQRVLTSKWHEGSWGVLIRMEKPTAVPMADCPIVEVRATRESLTAQPTAGTS